MTLDYMRQTGRDEHRIALVEAYLQARRACSATRTRPTRVFTDTLELDLSTVEP